ncbi:endonuclease/exonuclease/phosphatase family protein [Vibrio gallicus]|uniref:endonuclease/exonuclease/phosphatase family protein n=1 Tax=Vibrio gallicus TaxID=190897 RepID=UPI0021C3D33E|nr:endonuclease/exonuclease/phosphatase family protein [Vibrio gallicus]
MKGFIAKKHLAFRVIILCIIFGSPVAYSQQLRIATWNIAWLTKEPYPQFSQSIRSSQDWQTLQQYADQLSVDVLAFQEVDSKQAISKVMGDNYRIVLSERSLTKYHRHQFSDINQYTGFAVRNTWRIINHADLNLNTSPNGKLRFATYIELHQPSKESIHLLSVHLKAGCQAKKRSTRSCAILEKQAKQVNLWITQRELKRQPYIIMGDFNHNLAYPNDWLWNLIASNSSPALATVNTKATCEIRSDKNPNHTHRFRSLIDHIIVSKGLATRNTAQVNYQKRDVLQYQLSDHCPLRATLY